MMATFISFQLFFVLFMVCTGNNYNGNIAKGRPSFQSSNHSSTQWFAGIANNGNYGRGIDEPLAYSHTANQRHAWWAVKLEESSTVIRVTIVNRRDGSGGVGERLSNFVVGMTDKDPTTTAPSHTSLRMCATYPGTSHLGEVIMLTCDPAVSGTYLVVQLRGTNFLHLCEVEVFGQLGVFPNPQ